MLKRNKEKEKKLKQINTIYQSNLSFFFKQLSCEEFAATQETGCTATRTHLTLSSAKISLRCAANFCISCLGLEFKD